MPNRLTSKATQGPSMLSVASDPAWDSRAPNGDGSALAFCEAVVPGYFRGRLERLEVSFLMLLGSAICEAVVPLLLRLLGRSGARR